MSLEQALVDATTAMKDLTAALNKGAAANGAADTGKTTKTTKTTKEEKAAGPSRDEVNAALELVREKKGVDAAKSIIKDVGGAAKRADIPDDKLQAVADACKKAIEGGEDDGGL